MHVKLQQYTFALDLNNLPCSEISGPKTPTLREVPVHQIKKTRKSHLPQQTHTNPTPHPNTGRQERTGGREGSVGGARSEWLTYSGLTRGVPTSQPASTAHDMSSHTSNSLDSVRSRKKKWQRIQSSVSQSGSQTQDYQRCT